MSSYAYCHFCDDIRFEQGNKLSLMGIYSSELIVQQMPVNIPKICANIYFNSPSNKHIESLTAKIILDDKTIQEHSLTAEELRLFQSSLEKIDMLNEPLERIQVSLNIIIYSLLIQSPCILKAIMIVDGKEYVASKLRLKVDQNN